MCLLAIIDIFGKVKCLLSTLKWGCSHIAELSSLHILYTVPLPKMWFANTSSQTVAFHFLNGNFCGKKVFYFDSPLSFS